STRSLWSIKVPSRNKGTDVSLHSFPQEKTRRKKWEDACGRVQLPKDPRLCSSHFSASDLICVSNSNYKFTQRCGPLCEIKHLVHKKDNPPQLYIVRQ
uniref:THAP-type domain-containing protein n=1 Tax=Pundamilia nyererei TaxID=303518 RepID=A0A3B4GY63_9CICH